jgi:hypothetical protein
VKVNIICTPAVQAQVRCMMQETLLGPSPDDVDASKDFAASMPEDAWPRFQEEGFCLDGLRRKLEVDTMMQFTDIDPHTMTCKLSDSVTVSGFVDRNTGSGFGQGLTLGGGSLDPRRVKIVDTGTEEHPDAFELDFPANCTIKKREAEKADYKPFDVPKMGVTMLGCSHGFDAKERTTGFVIWMNRKGIMVDPPPHSSDILQRMGIPSSSIDSVLVTHCHADHDAGTFQKILLDEKITIYTTHTIMQSFMRKYAALTGFETSFLEKLFKFQPLKVGEKFEMDSGGILEIFYSLHVIPCIGLKASMQGRSMVYSGDTRTDPKLFEAMLHEDKAIGQTRYEHLKTFPWESDLILHEMGVPPIHTSPDFLKTLPDDVKQR